MRSRGPVTVTVTVTVTGLLVAWLCAGSLLHAGESWEPRGGLNEPTEAQARGREVFREEACFTCHGVRARPAVTGLERAGPARTEDWLLGHLYDPRSLHPHSPMPGSPQFFTWPDQGAERQALIERFDADGDGRVSFTRDARPDWASHAREVSRMTVLDVAGVRIPPRSARQTRSGEELWPGAAEPYVDRFVPGEEAGDGVLSPRDGRPKPSQRARDLVAYVAAVDRPAPLPTRGALDKEALDALVALGGRLVTRQDGGRMRARLRAPDTVPPEVLREGARLFARHCAACHGKGGRGNGPAARFLDTPPTDLAAAQFKYRSTLPGRDALLTDVFRTVRHGLPGSGMPGLPGLTPRQLWAVTLHTRSLAATPPKASAPVELPPVPALVLRSEDDQATYKTHLARGKAIFVAFECSRCHGTEGRGDGPDAIVEWSDGRQIRARDFKPRDATDEPKRRLRGGASPADLWRTIMAGLDKEGMPSVHAEFEAARKAGARGKVDRRLFQPLKDPALFAVGVVPSKDGPYEERLTSLYVGVEAAKDGYARFGDDWCLVLYVLSLLRTEDEVERGVIAWPKIEVRK